MCRLIVSGGGSHYDKARKSGVLKSKWSSSSGGSFVAVVGDEPLPIAHTWYHLLGICTKYVIQACMEPSSA